MKEDWNKSFCKLKFPAIECFFSSQENKDKHNFNILIGRSLDKYPKFLVTFDNYLAHKSHEEIGYEFDPFIKNEALKSSNSIFLTESTWISSMSSAINFLHQNRTIRHFIFAGGDKIVELITESQPKISIIEGPKNFKYKI